MKKRIVFLITGIVLILLAGWLIWNKFASTTHIALVNFQHFQATSIIKSNKDKNIKYTELSVDNLSKINNYDFTLIFGMGLKISEEQREELRKDADKGTPFLVFAATNPDNALCSLDGIAEQAISEYLSNGNRKNFQSMARYIRKNIDGKSFFTATPDSVVESASDVLYHIDDNFSFKTVEEYEGYLKSNNFYTEGGAKIAFVGGLNDPFSGNKDDLDSMIVSFQRAGMNVYPIASMMMRLEFLKQVQPSAVVYMAHGRLAMGRGDAAVAWLQQQNIPIFAPLVILQTKEEWTNDAQGMFGGYMSQSMVLPELDGCIYPYVISTQEIDNDGLYSFQAIPERLASFTNIVKNFVSLQTKANSNKKLAIYYFKGPGRSTLSAQGLETVPALYNLLKWLKQEGYKVDNLPSNVADFENLLMIQGAVLSTYAQGAFDDYLKNGKPALINKAKYEEWISKSLPKELYNEVVELYGDAPGEYMSITMQDTSYLAVGRIELGNIVLLPQPMAGLGSDAFAIIHGAKSPPPHPYIGAYLWAQHEFKADAMMHFGTHGSLEFTPQKQMALSNMDWADRLVGEIPHFYYYTIGNVGESMMAKRRSYATVVSYLTPPFTSSNLFDSFRSLKEKIHYYFKSENINNKEKAALELKAIAVEMGLHRDLRLDSVLNKPYTDEEIERIEDFAEEIANEKMGGSLYTTGESFGYERILSTVEAMSADPIAYSLASLDYAKGKITEQQFARQPFLNHKYLNPTKTLISKVLKGQLIVDTAFICRIADISKQDLIDAEKILTPPRRGMMAMMKQEAERNKKVSDSDSSAKAQGGHPQSQAKGHPHGQVKGHPHGHPGMQKPAEYTKEEKDRARAILEVARTLTNILIYKEALENSPQAELNAISNALSGGYIAPSSGGDAIANPRAVPTGRNLYSINAEAVPSEVAWHNGIYLVNNTLEQYKKQHGTYPQKVSYTFWSSEFIESEGTTIAQALYMLGVEPVRDAFGRVSDVHLIPSEKLGRPRIDVVVQTSGQFRDLAASRLALLTKAVILAASSTNDKYENYVAQGSAAIESTLVDRGVSPKDARALSDQRVFGGINGMYGTGIQEMVKSSDKWEEEEEIADVYINNMGALYGDLDDWGSFNEGLFRAALENTDVVIQPRQSNVWGALSLDHVFEFMGGLNLAVRSVTGKDPESYFADYRNRNRMKIQELKEAIGVEARVTVFNPNYIKEVMKGQASSAAQISEVVTNTFAWNVMKPSVIDNEMWDQFHDIYVNDSYKLGVREFFEEQNSEALEEITAIMMESARKGMWSATDKQLQELANLHSELVNKFGSSGTGFAASNEKLQKFIAEKLDAESAKQYNKELQKMREADATNTDVSNGMVLQKESSNNAPAESNKLNGFIIAAVVLVVFLLLFILLKRRRQNNA